MRVLRWVILGVVLFGAACLFHAVQIARESARRANCQSHLNQLQFALQCYHQAHGSFPPAFVPGPDGKPWHSWRVLILPIIEQQAVYEQYRFDEPWNGPNNRQLADKINVSFFQCPSGPEFRKTPYTNYVAIVGNETAFPGKKTTSLSDMCDGPENTILLVEITNSDIHWMEPRDLNADTMSYRVNDPERPAISSPHPVGPAVVFADRINVYHLGPHVSEDTIRALTTIDGGEPVKREDIQQ